MTSALNSESENSVMGLVGGKRIPADGTGKCNHKFEVPQLTCTGVIKLDPWLEPFRDALRSRYSYAQKWIKTIDETEGGLEKFSKGTEKFGFVVHDNGEITYREWAPNALRAYLIGDFSKASSSTSFDTSSLTGARHKTNGIGMLHQ